MYRNVPHCDVGHASQMIIFNIEVIAKAIFGVYSLSFCCMIHLLEQVMFVV